MRQYLDVNSKKNELRLLIKHPSYKDAVIVCVEGKTDIRVFRKLLNHDKIRLSGVEGKDALLKIMDALHLEFPGQIFGICDADFDHLRGDASDAMKKSIYMTDFHDIEIMMLKSDSLRCFLCEYSNDDAFTQLESDLMDNALVAANPLGLLRWANAEADLGINFKGLPYCDFLVIDEASVDMDEDLLITELIKRSPDRSAVADKEYLKQKVIEYRAKKGSPLQVASGHDLTNILAVVMRQNWASSDDKLNFRKVESALRMAYQPEMFKETSLCTNLLTAFLLFGISLEKYV